MMRLFVGLLAASAVRISQGAGVLVVNGDGVSVHHPANRGALEAADVATAVARVMDLPQPVGDQDAALPAGDIFHRPGAVVVLSVDALSKDAVDELDFELPALRALMSGSGAYALGDAASGNAVRELLAGPGGASLADSLSARYDDQPLVICAWSGASDDASKNACGGAFSPDEASLNFTSPLWNRFVKRGGRLTSTDGVATVGLGETVATFDTNVPADHALLRELQLFAQLPSTLSQAEATSDRLSDDIPDLLLLGSSALRGLADRHGVESAEYAMALALLDSALPELQKTYAQAPWKSLVWAVVMPDPANAHHESKHGGHRRLLATAEVSVTGAHPANFERVKSFGWEAQMFQIQVWTFIGFAFVIFFASSFLYHTDYGRDDAGLYSKYKPNFNDGKIQ